MELQTQRENPSCTAHNLNPALVPSPNVHVITHTKPEDEHTDIMVLAAG
jgi:hypothetical protein